ncbi:hypothetical protein HYC85_014685 [Camellia sinensis]|uniref:Kinesin motor domain-containing protein n=1 Tax=Camellia sinensis TaxID=4442 RepID=A0A7J7HA89_CAMSI|nr:hypothetical protein HYC85_014685 [Camellia sinensis]
MEDNQWHDPLLITDVSWQLEQTSHSHCKIITNSLSLVSLPKFSSILSSFFCSIDPNFTLQTLQLHRRFLKHRQWQIPTILFMLIQMMVSPRWVFSLTSPDLVICAGSPDIPSRSYVDSPQFLKGGSIELSLENGINGPEMEGSHETPAAAIFPASWKSGEDNADENPEASLELLPLPVIEDKILNKSLPVISINSGSLDDTMILGGTKFLEDSCFNGGDTIRTDTKIGDGGLGLYQTARFGNFSYQLKTMESGNYIVDLHLAEIVFTDGPPGMRVFDVYIQEQKAVSCMDIFARVGANKPLVIGDLKAFVSGDDCLSIRFEGVTGSPIVCGISVRKDLSASFGEVELLKAISMSQLPECVPSKDSGVCEAGGEFQKLQIEFECQKKELTETRRVLEKLKSENECKSRECQEAWKSLQDLQNELMRKSMHVGSLAFAIEGQVKEKSRWFSSLRDLKRKMKLLKMDQIKLSEEALSYKKCLVDMNDMSSIIQSKVNQQVELHEDLKIKFIKGAKERKELYNKILELKGNIRVFCRCRPLNTEEIASGASMAIDFEAAKDGELTVKSNGAPKKTFKFDAIFGPQSNQVDVFEDTAPFASSVLDGYNVCIFAYGQTGTGKTFTMEGTNEARGVNFRTLEELFRTINERKGQIKYEISVSVLEVYNEQIRDLLVPGTQPGPGVTAKRLEIRQVGEGIHHVPGLVEAQVSNMSEVWEVLQTGSNARAVGSTNANEHSSRSHWNSKLTHLLQDSLGGDSKTLMFVQISPNENDLSETLCSLNFASRVRGIELGPAKKQLDSTELIKYKQLVEKTKIELKIKDVQIKKMEDTIHGLDVKMKEKDLKNKNLQDKIKELESQLLIERRLARQHVDSKLAEQQQQQQQQLTRPPLATRPLGIHKNFNEGKEQVNQTRPLTENNNSYKVQSPPPPTESFVKHNDPTEKENNPEISEQPLPIPKRTGRASLCPIAQRFPAAPAPRRNSLIPLPSAPGSVKFTQPLLLPLQPILQTNREEESDGAEAKRAVPEPTPWDSPKEHKSGGKKLSSVLRRSLQKRIQMRSPMQQHMRRGGINVGMEKVRVSIGSRGRAAHRVLLGSGRRTTTKDVQQKQSQREKEKGWNIGTAGRTVV